MPARQDKMKETVGEDGGNFPGPQRSKRLEFAQQRDVCSRCIEEREMGGIDRGCCNQHSKISGTNSGRRAIEIQEEGLRGSIEVV